MPRKGSKVNQLDDDDEIGDQPGLPRAFNWASFTRAQSGSSYGTRSEPGFASHLVPRLSVCAGVGGVGSIQ